jgi:hypothetical protein
MNKLGLNFDHFGLAVNNPDEALKFLIAQDYKEIKRVYDELQNVNLIYMEHNILPNVELIYPSNNFKECPLVNLLKKSTSSLYHLCFRVDNILDFLSKLKVQNIRYLTVSASKKAVLFDDKTVSFYNISGFGLIELIEENNIDFI